MQELISQDYDNEVEYSKRSSYEAYLALSKQAREELNKEYFVYYLITKSIKRVKRKISNLRLCR